MQKIRYILISLIFQLILSSNLFPVYELLSKFISHYCLHCIIPRILHIISRKSWYSMQAKSWWRAIRKMCVYLISLFYSNREIHENLMLAKYTCFTVNYPLFSPKICSQACHHYTTVLRAAELVLLLTSSHSRLLSTLFTYLPFYVIPFC